MLTVSDTRTESTDKSGPEAEAALHTLGFQNIERKLCRDEIAEIQQNLQDLATRCKAVFTTGGTGFSPRDVTPEATAPLLDRRADNLSELMRLKGLEHTPFSYLSRGVAGVLGSTLIVNLPGSPAGARQGIEAIGQLLPLILEGLEPA